MIATAGYSLDKALLGGLNQADTVLKVSAHFLHGIGLSPPLTQTQQKRKIYVYIKKN